MCRSESVSLAVFTSKGYKADEADHCYSVQRGLITCAKSAPVSGDTLQLISQCRCVWVSEGSSAKTLVVAATAAAAIATTDGKNAEEM